MITIFVLSAIVLPVFILFKTIKSLYEILISIFVKKPINEHIMKNFIIGIIFICFMGCLMVLSESSNNFIDNSNLKNNRNYKEQNSGEMYQDNSDNNSDNNLHYVKPHHVNGYERSDGTKVEGYWRGGNTGYERSNPDGNPYNNLK